jgi:hypothetical protein
VDRNATIPFGAPAIQKGAMLKNNNNNERTGNSGTLREINQ